MTSASAGEVVGGVRGSVASGGRSVPGEDLAAGSVADSVSGSRGVGVAVGPVCSRALCWSPGATVGVLDVA